MPRRTAMIALARGERAVQPLAPGERAVLMLAFAGDEVPEFIPRQTAMPEVGRTAR